MIEIDFRTPLKRERDERDKKIYEKYMEIISQGLPAEATKWALWRALGEIFGLQPQGIRTILLRMEKKLKSQTEQNN
jgi:hypothetical protein